MRTQKRAKVCPLKESPHDAILKIKNPFQKLKDQAASCGASPAKAITPPLNMEAKGGIFGDLSRKELKFIDPSSPIKESARA